MISFSCNQELNYSITMAQGSLLPEKKNFTEMRLKDYEPHCSDYGSGKDRDMSSRNGAQGMGLKHEKGESCVPGLFHFTTHFLPAYTRGK